MNIRIEYEGCYPNLCSGDLVVFVDGTRYIFPKYCLSSGGSVSFDSNWGEIIEEGPWSISDWPEDVSEELKQDIIDAVNSQIPLGCCGGCV